MTMNKYLKNNYTFKVIMSNDVEIPLYKQTNGLMFDEKTFKGYVELLELCKVHALNCHKTEDYTADKKHIVTFYTFNYKSLKDLDNILICKDEKTTKSEGSLLDMLKRNQANKKRKCAKKDLTEIDGFIDDESLHDGLACYGVLIDMNEKEVSLVASWKRDFGEVTRDTMTLYRDC